MPSDICRFRFGPAPGAKPHARPRSRPARRSPPRPRPRSRQRLQARGQPRPRPAPDCCAGEGAAGRGRPGSRTARTAGHAAPAPRPGKEPLLKGAPGPLPRGAGTAARRRARASELPPPGSGAAVAESPQLPGERTPRAHGRTPPHTHSHALHTHGVSGPTPVPRNRGLPAPSKGSTQFTEPQPPAPASRDPRAEARGRGGRPSRRPARPGLASTARAPRARPRHEAGRKGRRRDWGWHRESATGAPRHRHRHPPVTTSPAAQKAADGTAVPRQPTGGSPLLRVRRASGRGAGAGAGAGEASGCGAETGWRPPAAPAGHPLRSHRAQRQLPPGAVPASAAAFPPSSGCGVAARQGRARLSRPPHTRRRAGPREKGAREARRSWRRGGVAAWGAGREAGGVLAPRAQPGPAPCGRSALPGSGL